MIVLRVIASEIGIFFPQHKKREKERKNDDGEKGYASVYECVRACVKDRQKKREEEMFRCVFRAK